ncbi:hypothetical protein [Collinsella sp. An2]|uniref:hypothetical protein n=1 Tax=Collinsella sp. An2 TaxID=1965585 RepID=UPI000B3966C1|nr:hypothetical protein [Collinsella sp. An2]OUP07177.1 hypothetical protein B5F33_09185 [Collinsella sp. An2]
MVALVPMVAISAFDHSYADDWHYGVDAYLVLQAGGGIAGAVRAAIQEVIDTYDSWQGTYSAIFLMALQPGVFSEALYGAGAVGIMASLVLSTGYATSVAVRDVVGASRAPWLAVTCVALLLQTQLLPSPVEGFWWYNSAIYYTFYHALMLGMAGLAVRLLRGCTHRGPLTRHGVVLRSLLLTALAFVVAGGNFVTGLVSAVGLFAVAVAGLARRPRRAALLLPALFVLVAGFVVSMAAPGNEARQVSQFAGDNLGVVLTLVRSGLAGIEYAVLWTNGYLVLGLLALLPVMVRIAQEARCSYHLPGVPALASLALFMASFAPTFYSMGTVGPGRVQNIRYDLFVLAVLLCVGWFVGWCVRRAEAHGLLDAASPPAERPAALGAHARPAVSEVDGRAALPGAGVQTVGAQRASSCRRLLAVLYASIAAVLAFSLVALAVDSRHVDDLVSISAAHALMTGTAQEYDQQVCDRIDLIESSPEDQLEVPFYTVGPKVLFMGDIRDNMDNYINFRLAQWYGKESIVGYHGQL